MLLQKLTSYRPEEVSSGCKYKKKRLLIVFVGLLRDGAAEKEPPKIHGSDSVS